MIEIQDLDGIFGGDINMSKLLPSMDSIPEEFKRWPGGKWNKVVSDWFFCGLKNAKWVPKPGINTSKALDHIFAIMVSFEPKHEHKEAGCAYLLSEWFDDVTY
jgi:hypothetical protein